MTALVQFVTLKAFGDLTIAATALERSSAGRGFHLLLGSHLLALASALDIRIPWAALPLDEAGVPAMYDVRRCGALAAARSLFRTRRALGKANVEGSLLFDRVGPRERFLAFPRQPRGLPAAANIYLAYRALSGESEALPAVPSIPLGTRKVGLFAGSRVQAKNIPAPLVDATLAACVAEGWDAQLYLLDGERPDLQTRDRPHIVVPRKFEAMKAAVAACDAVLSADSLPAHLAERANRPVFVLSPVPNHFWLPLSAYTANRHSLFDEGIEAPTFRRFIETPIANAVQPAPAAS